MPMKPVPINKGNIGCMSFARPAHFFQPSIPSPRQSKPSRPSGSFLKFTGWLMHYFLSSYLSFETCLHPSAKPI